MLPLTDTVPGGFGLYVHWPFCASKCPYCDFNSHVREGVDQARWRAAMLREMDHFAARVPVGRRLSSVFFGGGTPSLMPPETVAAILERANHHWGITDGVEVTLEANPTSSEAARFAGFRAAGVNRLSMGIQALNDADLKVLGRKHSAGEAMAVIAMAKGIFDRFSFDLIYARPGQTVAAWQDELSQALDMAVGHLSLYQLTIEEGTQFHTLHQRGDLVVPDEDLAGDLYEATQVLLNQAGMPAYEVSNHARPGQESRHNLVYWRYGDYVGIGPGAHGRLTLKGEKTATRTHRAPEIWLQRVEEAGTGAHADERVTPEQRGREALMMGLRLAEGVSLARLTAEAGGVSPVDMAAVDRLSRHGLLTLDGDRLTATADGRQRLNGVLAALLG
ncbi:radical SAM family heme chaperone HemW [Nitrospirillum viridazoti]|uniref:Heme chaperone HemW n=1 Tax=Nitrospirillum viridazoti CBAmc TaxID=1441467 RepID=A0A248JSG1_9PROT|nr:radical SAM family heme chaperone HemW [Nitrospirillum amazonense]ASG21652.1 coproporphyrinogen III oxidase [Nitrospirillum amazonense CBAmc]TWB42190.1 oxygen-independent coproporphyrinogen-3 oxidase [Nitrospirillum amazonense]